MKSKDELKIKLKTTKLTFLSLKRIVADKQKSSNAISNQSNDSL